MRLDLFSKNDKVLLLGEGNFSFSVSLFNHNLPIQITSTCFEEKILNEEYLKNIEYLKSKNVPVFLNVDATKLHENKYFQNKTFTKIIFNFPHIGGKMKIHLNRILLKKFFESATHIITENGLIIISLCKGQGGTPLDEPQRRWDDSWQITEMAAHGNFILTTVEPFQEENFKEYHCIGYRSQNVKFNLHGALVHVFVKAKPPYLCINENTALERLKFIPLEQNSLVFVPVIYSELYNNNPFKNPVSPFSFLKSLLLSDLKMTLPKKRWKILSDKDIPVYVESEKGVPCVVGSNKNQCFLRSNPVQIFNTIFKILENFEFENEIIFFPGMYFNSLMNGRFMEVSPIEINILILGKSILPCVHKHTNNLFSIFKEEKLSCKTHTKETLKHTENNNDFFIDSETELICENKEKEIKFTAASSYVVVWKKKEFQVVVVNIQKMINYFFKVESQKQILAENSEVIIHNNGRPVLTQKMLYPRMYKFDITLKYFSDNKFLEKEFYKILWLAAGQIINEVQLVNEFVSDKEWSSKCYRITYKSLDKPLFRNRVLDIHSKVVGPMLEHGLGVTIS